MQAIILALWATTWTWIVPIAIATWSWHLIVTRCVAPLLSWAWRSTRWVVWGIARRARGFRTVDGHDGPVVDV